MPRSSPGLINWNAGELGLNLEARVDLAKYASGAYALENFIPLVQGPVRRRPGTRFVNEVKNSANPTGLIPFKRSANDAIMIEVGDHYMRFYKNYAPVMGTIIIPPFTWNPTPTGTTVDNTATWTNEGKPAWVASATHAVGDFILDPNGNIQVVVKILGGFGFSGSTLPVFSNTPYNASPLMGVTYDGDLIWGCFGKPAWTQNTVVATTTSIQDPINNSISIPTLILDSNGNIEEVTIGGTTSAGASQPIIYELASPYAYTDLFDSNGASMLVYVQSADVIYITHRSKTFPGYKLSHFGDTDWTLAPVNFLGGPFATLNNGTNPIVYASAQTGNGITLTASANIFDPNGNGDLIGSNIQLTQWNIRTIRQWESGHYINKGALRRFNGVTYKALNGTNLGASPPAPVTGNVPPTHLSGQAYDGSGANGGAASGILWEYQDAGFGFAQIVSVGGTPVGSAVAITNITAAKPPVVTIAGLPTGGLADNQLIFITGVVGMDDVNDAFYYVNGLSGLTFNLYQDDTDGNGTNGPVDGTQWNPYISGGTVDTRLWTATANVPDQSNAIGTINQLPRSVIDYPNATPIWAFSTWNNRDGYPQCVCFFRGRLAFGRAGDIEISVSQDFENFSALTPGGLVTADMAVSIILPIQDDIEWICDGRVMLAGTESSEQIVVEANPNEAFGPGNAESHPATLYGSYGIQGQIIGQYVVFIQTARKKVRAIRYNLYLDNYDGPDITVSDDEVTYPGVIAMAYQQEPDTVLWAISGPGTQQDSTAPNTLLGLTYRIESQGIGLEEDRL